MGRGDEMEYPRVPGDRALWAVWIIGPAAWALHLQVSYLMVSRVCASGNYAALHLVTLATLLMAAGGALLAWRQWRQTGTQAAAGGMPPRRFIAFVGLLINGLSALVILAEGIPNFVLSACQ